MKDPYQVLGVSPSATDEEIKDAYRALVKKYHPDKFADSDLAELANEKMKEVNSAYDEIQKMRNGSNQGRSQHSGAYGGAYGGAYSGGFNPGRSSSSEFYTRVRQLINMGRFAEAESMLNAVPGEERNAEWNFLFGCILMRKRYYADAQRYFDMACNQDPYNTEYRDARDRLHQTAAGYGRGYRTSANSASACDICSSLLCADCCCECMGGDLISCC